MMHYMASFETAEKVLKSKYAKFAMLVLFETLVYYE